MSQTPVFPPNKRRILRLDEEAPAHRRCALACAPSAGIQEAEANVAALIDPKASRSTLPRNDGGHDPACQIEHGAVSIGVISQAL